MDTKDMKVNDIVGSHDYASGQIEDFDVNEAALVRKIDWRIVPTLFLAYFLQFLDKVIINYANVMGLQKDLHMKGNDFSWTATAFFIGYAVAEIPQGFLLQKFPVAKVLGFNILLWGIILCCSAACQGAASLIAVRTLLGMCEAVIAPSLIMITSMWYTKAESTPRYGVWYCGLGAGQIIGGLISFGAQHSTSSFHGWRIMFLVVGAVNMLVACLIIFTLPESPTKATFIDEHEKAVISIRLTNDQAGTGEKVFRRAALFKTLVDPQTWMLVLLTICITIPSGVITTFSAVLIHSFGYNSKQSALLNMPSGCVSIFATMASTYAVAKKFPRWLSILAVLVPALIGAALLSFMGTHRQGGALAGIYMVNFIVAPLAIIYAWVGANFSGYTAKITGSAVISAAFSVANIIGPQTYQARDAPGYTPAKITVLAVVAAAMVVVMALRVLYGFRNRAAVRKATESGDGAAFKYSY
ncbi:hypothetical protein MBLNU459_g7050t1 [Dothideomycetes sp. NU459]